jgi:DNA modification methylase
MYKICLASFDALKPGGIFFYNIGDIFDNPNTIVKSKMGEKRLALGAYLILLFKSAGFELLDNIIWDKGETQSNRHKNDGNFTPYYQRPANCYEHMFIFKKPGKLLVCTEPLLKENIQKFSPVIKINSKGENLFGHTAPYPPDLPLISIKTFTK